MATALDPFPATIPARRPAIRLASGALFWRLMGGLTLLFALMLGSAVARFFPPGQRMIVFLFQMPMFAAASFFLAALITIVVDLAVRLIVRPRMIAWLVPRGDDFGSAFHLDPRERTLVESPARMARGRRSWAPGRLVLTDRRLLFLPHAWDVEPWSSPRSRLSARAVDPPRAFWGLVRGVPPRLEVVADGQPHTFALLDAPAWSGLVAG